MGGRSNLKHPILYAKDATDFFSLGLGVLTNTLEAKVTEERNGSFFLEAKVLTDTEMYKKIELDSLIKADAGASLKDQRFRVKRVIENHDGTADIYAEHISYLTQELSLKPRVLLKGNGTGALNQWANAIIDKHPFVTSSTVRTESQTSLEIGDVDNAREALGGVQGSILDKWGGEYLFDNYHIALKEKRGKTANTLIAYGRNITDFEQEKNIMSTYTSLFPYARYTDDDQNEHLVTLPEYLVDSEYVKNYPNRKALPVDFSSEFEGKNKPTPDKLRTLAERYIKDNEVGIPKVSIQVSFLDLSKTLDYKEMATLEELNLCDDVRVEYPKLGVSTVSKVVKIVWDVLADRYDTIEIGAKRTTLGTTIKEQNDTIKEIEKNSNNAQLSADGKNMIFYGLYGEDGLGEPTATKVGDLWYKPNGDYTIMYVWNGTVWEQVLNTEDEAIIKDELVQMDKEVQEAKDKADEVAVSLVEVQKDADEAKASAEQSKLDAQKALAENEVTKAEAQKAKEQSDQAIKDASTSMLNAKEALDKATENETSIGGLQVDIDKTKNELKTKANQSDLNTLKGTVTNQQTQITQNATDIKTKAEKTYVDTINNKVDKQQTQINQNSESIKLKAEKQEVTNLKNELDGLEFSDRNLVVNTGNYNDYEFGSDNSNGKDYEISGNKLHIKPSNNGNFYWLAIFGNDISFEKDKDYILSMTIKSSSPTTVGIYWYPSEKYSLWKADVNEEWTTFHFRYTQTGETIDNPKQSTKHLMGFHRLHSDKEYWVKEIKLTQANKPTAWSPAPEDMASADQVKDISASLEVQAGKIEMKADQVVVDNLKNTVDKQGTAITQNSEAIKLKAEKSQVDSLTGKVDKQQTEINQNADHIKLKANQSTVNDIDKKVTNQQAQINLNSENIKLKAEKSEVTNLKNELDGLEVGGQNYIQNSKGDFVLVPRNTGQAVDNYSYKQFDVPISSKNQYMFTCEVEKTHGTFNKVTVLVRGPKSDFNLNYTADISNGKIVVNIPANDKNVDRDKILVYAGIAGQTRGNGLKIRKVKLEKGNRATDWSPAPEDLASQSDVTSLSASIDVQANQIKNLVTKTDGHSTQLANLTIEADRISSQVVELQNEEIGTNNLLRNSDFNPEEYGVWATSDMAKFSREDVSSGKDVLTPRGKMGIVRFIGGASDTGALRQEVHRGFSVADKTYSLSFYHARGNGLATNFKVYLNFRKGGRTLETVGKRANITSTDNFTRYTETFKTTVTDFDNIELVFEFPSGQSNVGRILQLQAPTLVVGSRVTDWTPGNETTYSQITQLSDDILLRVRKGDVINQINISTEGILIDGAKTHITGKTTIDNAVIKDAMIANVSANKLTAGTIDANKINVINLNANNIAAGTLNGIYINLDKTMTIAENGSINSSYRYGEPYGETYDARWFNGTSRYGNRYINFLGDIYKVKSNNEQGAFDYYSETFFGSDILKMRKYKNSSTTGTPISHLDITSRYFSAGPEWANDFDFNFEKGTAYIRTLTVTDGNKGALYTGRINAPAGFGTLTLNQERKDLADFNLGSERVYSVAVYNRTYSSGSQVCVTSAGTLGRVTSAAKYKLDIEKPDNVINNAFKMLEIEPKMWFDKHEVETIAEAMTNNELGELVKERQLRRHYGFIADDFHDKGLTEVVTYDEKGEIEGLQYDRISMYHNVILKRQQDEIETLKRQVAELTGGD